jgi:hypothetical protein
LHDTCTTGRLPWDDVSRLLMDQHHLLHLVLLITEVLPVWQILNSVSETSLTVFWWQPLTWSSLANEPVWAQCQPRILTGCLHFFLDTELLASNDRVELERLDGPWKGLSDKCFEFRF